MKRNETDSRIGKHPFHQRKDIISGYQFLEDGQVTGKAQLGSHTEHVSPDASSFLHIPDITDYQHQSPNGT